MQTKRALAAQTRRYRAWGFTLRRVQIAHQLSDVSWFTCVNAFGHLSSWIMQQESQRNAFEQPQRADLPQELQLYRVEIVGWLRHRCFSAALRSFGILDAGTPQPLPFANPAPQPDPWKRGKSYSAEPALFSQATADPVRKGYCGWGGFRGKMNPR